MNQSAQQEQPEQGFRTAEARAVAALNSAGLRHLTHENAAISQLIVDLLHYSDTINEAESVGRSEILENAIAQWTVERSCSQLAGLA